MLELFEPGIRAEVKRPRRHVDSLEYVVQFLRSHPCIVTASETRQQCMNFIEIDSIAAVIAVATSETQAAARKSLGDNPCNFSYLIVCFVGANVEELVVHGAP